MGVSISNLEFTCPFEPGSRFYPRSAQSGGNGHVFEIKTVAPGRFVDSYNLIQLNPNELLLYIIGFTLANCIFDGVGVWCL